VDQIIIIIVVIGIINPSVQSWRAQAQSGEALLKSLESEVAALTKAKNELNQTRKLSQTLAGGV
jgi:prefoldin subunit 5